MMVGSLEPGADGAPSLKPSSLEGEYLNVFVLFVLYTLQGIPMGFSATLPMILQERGASYTQLGMFAVVSWPFSLKVLWAPLIDSVYSERAGRRKTWLVPVQLLIGMLLCMLSARFDEWTGKGQISAEIRIEILTFSFFVLYFLCATQDITVDGWALTMLRTENSAYQSSCNAAGQTAGYVIAFTGSMALEQLGMMKLTEFMFLCGLAFIGITIAVAMFKREAEPKADEEVEGVVEVYAQVAQMSQKPALRRLIFMLLVFKIPFAGPDAIVGLKLQEKGMAKETMAYLSTLFTPLAIVTPALISPFVSKGKALDFFRRYVWLPWVSMCFMGLLFVHFYNLPDPLIYTGLLCIGTGLSIVISTAGFVSMMAFFGGIAPHDIGGTYLTVLNSFMNLGRAWVTPLSFWTVDKLTVKNDACTDGVKVGESGCEIITDGYYILTIFCCVVGVLAQPWFCSEVEWLESRKPEEWRPRAQLGSFGLIGRILGAGCGDAEKSDAAITIAKKKRRA